MLVSVTRLHVKGKRYLPSFVWHTIQSTVQLRKAEGLQHSSFYKEGWFTYWTLTVWDQKSSMLTFRNKGRHLKAMKNAKNIADQLESIHWETENIPLWDDCRRRLHSKYGRQ